MLIAAETKASGLKSLPQERSAQARAAVVGGPSGPTLSDPSASDVDRF
ncbi:hypothetical protein GLE_5264 [Lysobacter enzymogenes]|uniref:Uncharacterized protein n=1 Tax=Lysobacter enzymogenes TaxID=69 RepID=A0A0S2DQG0_LYSEN|nr:hypothetical protein GLE_5264 [Lysobacter enzymogenes]